MSQRDTYEQHKKEKAARERERKKEAAKKEDQRRKDTETKKSDAIAGSAARKETERRRREREEKQQQEKQQRADRDRQRKQEAIERQRAADRERQDMKEADRWDEIFKRQQEQQAEQQAEEQRQQEAAEEREEQKKPKPTREEQRPDKNGMLSGKIHHELPERAQAYAQACGLLAGGMVLAEGKAAEMGADVMTLCDMVIAHAAGSEDFEAIEETINQLRDGVVNRMQELGNVTGPAADAFAFAQNGPVEAPWTRPLAQTWVIWRARLGEVQD